MRGIRRRETDMAYLLNGPVGRDCIRRGGNRPEDRDTARNAFQSVAPANGGTVGLREQDVGGLITAIETFQKRWWPGVRPDGVMEREGRTWRKVRALVGVGSPLAPSSSSNAPGGAKYFNPHKNHLFYQGGALWMDQKLNTSTVHTIWAKGCLLTCIACALSWKGVKIPPGEVARVKAERIRKGSSLGFYAESALTPSTLEAWMSLNGGQGYANRSSSDLDSGHISRMLNRKDVAFMGAHSPDRSDWLAMPGAVQMADWINQERILIVRRTLKPKHFLWITGHDGAGNFKVWDVGWPPENANHTAKVTADELDRVLHWAPRR
jgi:hypothetical protein